MPLQVIVHSLYSMLTLFKHLNQYYPGNNNHQLGRRLGQILGRALPPRSLARPQKLPHRLSTDSLRKVLSQPASVLEGCRLCPRGKRAFSQRGRCGVTRSVCQIWFARDGFGLNWWLLYQLSILHWITRMVRPTSQTTWRMSRILPKRNRLVRWLLGRTNRRQNSLGPIGLYAQIGYVPLQSYPHSDYRTVDHVDSSHEICLQE